MLVKLVKAISFFLALDIPSFGALTICTLLIYTHICMYKTAFLLFPFYAAEYDCNILKILLNQLISYNILSFADLALLVSCY